MQQHQPSTTTSLLRNVVEIRIAILGNSESGKMTTLNALLKENYSSAVMSKRSGAKGSVACYNVFVTGVDENTNSGSVFADINMIEEQTVMYGNEKVKTVTYEVETQHEMVQMRKNTQLAFVLVPGANIETSTSLDSSTTGSTKKYHSYIVENWDSFDAAIVVIDGKTGISDDDVKLLKLVKEKFNQREIPTIVLCNKIDSPEDEKLMKHVQKAKSKVNKIFGITDDTAEKNLGSNPVFVPCSALHAFIYRTGAKLTVYQFEDFDADLMDVIGKVHFGSKNWKAMTHEERFRKTHKILADPIQFKEGMDKSGFSIVMEKLNHHFGGAEKQEQMILKQIDHAISKLSPTQSEWISKSCLSIYQKQAVLALPSSIDSSDPTQVRLREAFWKTFEEFQENTFKTFMDTFPKDIQLVANPLQELMYYHKLLVRANWVEEENIVLNRAEEFVHRYIRFVLKHEKNTNNPSKWSLECKLSPLDWNVIFQSICLNSYDENIMKKFGPELVECSNRAYLAYNWKLSENYQKTNVEELIEVKYDDMFIATPVDEKKYKSVVHIELKNSILDPNHFGHPLHKFKQLCNMQVF